MQPRVITPRAHFARYSETFSGGIVIRARSVVMAVAIAVATATNGHAACTIDVQGADDLPGQKDATQFCNNGSCGGPAKGGNVKLSDGDTRLAVDYMVAEAKAAIAAAAKPVAKAAAAK